MFSLLNILFVGKEKNILKINEALKKGGQKNWKKKKEKKNSWTKGAEIVCQKKRKKEM